MKSRDCPSQIGLILMTVAVLAGCGGVSDIVVQIDEAAIIGGQTVENRDTAVEVIDARDKSTLERTTIGGVSMGKISFDPNHQELVRTVVNSATLRARRQSPRASPEQVVCGILVFDVKTPATALYWDVTTDITLALRVRGRERIVSTTNTERTYVWPTSELIQRVTTEALGQILVDSEAAISELLRED